jgi:alkylation response protein AidB-like acyl-CoA dehydrogenase
MAALSQEQLLIRDTAAAWARERSPVSALRALRDADNPDRFDRSIWAQMAQLGWAGILIPTRYGGSGLGYIELGLVLEETARTLTASPLLSTALTVTAALLLAGSDSQQRQWLPAIADGRCIAALAVDEGTHHRPLQLQLRAERLGTSYTLTGSKQFVIDGGAADLLLVAVRTAGRPGIPTASRLS